MVKHRLELSSFSLQGKIIVQCGVSGALGTAIAHALGSLGATLVLAGRGPIAPDLAGNFATPVEFLPVDVRQETAVEGLVSQVLARYARVDGLVYNTVSRPMRDIDGDGKQWEESLQVNANGFFYVVRAFARAMARQPQGGSIVNIASIHGRVGMNPFLYEGLDFGASPDYFFHKGGMLNLTRYLASCYGAKEVRINTVSPGGIYNNATPQPAKFVERYNAMTMLGRMARPDEIPGAVVFLLSEASRYITGADILVDGGYCAK
jgi:NAD(P)-dependent dehydrogenase (short-subunit alcohol dehydrogenase family)